MISPLPSKIVWKIELEIASGREYDITAVSANQNYGVCALNLHEYGLWDTHISPSRRVRRAFCRSVYVFGSCRFILGGALFFVRKSYSVASPCVRKLRRSKPPYTPLSAAKTAHATTNNSVGGRERGAREKADKQRLERRDTKQRSAQNNARMETNLLC